MHYDLIFLLEEPSTKTVLETILPKLIPAHICYKCIAHEGKQDLQSSIPKTIKGFSFSPNTKFVIVHDQDSHNCKKLKTDLSQLCQSAGNSNAMIRIICHELEAWFLGDLATVEKAYSLKPSSLSKTKVKPNFAILIASTLRSKN